MSHASINVTGRIARRRHAVVVLAAALLLAGCSRVGGAGAGAEGGRHPYTIPHVLRYATAGDITGLNPYFSSELVVHMMDAMTLAWLWRYDAQNRATPELATDVPTQQNGGISPDGRTLIWHLRHDAKWSDGVPFDADDVVFSIGQVLNPRNNVISRDGWDHIDRYAARDKYTVVVHLTSPVSTFVSTFFSTGGANPCILPKHLLAGLPDINRAPYNDLPIGIGPFKFSKWKRGDSVTMVANDAYFRGRPKLQRVVYKLIPDRNTTLTQLQTHEIDMYALVPPGYAARTAAIPGTTTLRLPGYAYAHLDFNVAHTAVADAAVRQALRFGTDRATILKKVYLGIGELQESPFPQAHPLFSAIPRVPFDPARANRMLDAAGWRRAADGIRVKGGQRLLLNVAVFSASPDYDTLFELLRAMWKPLGVGLDVHHYLPSKMFDTYQNGGIMYGGKFDIISFLWYTTAGGDVENLYGCHKFPPNGQNVLHYCNQAAEAALQDFKRSYDEARQRADDAIVLGAVTSDVPTFVLASRLDVYSYNSDLKDFHPHQVSPFDDMMNVDI